MQAIKNYPETKPKCLKTVESKLEYKETTLR